ncbi:MULTISPECIES: hypothetical protein [unclassified Oceanobacillus]|uniref:hypothetical protein n=1 Tax=unclassified Oceanobacillus TaxID=2630292 RepID=UPI00300DE2A5
MKQWAYLILFILIFLLVGCQVNNEEQTKRPSEMNEDELPDGRAFEDEFTRGLLESTEETRSGYYPFLSGTGKYEMDFPLNGMIDGHGYALKEKDYEGIFIGIDEGKLKSSIRLNYDSLDETGREGTILNIINERVGQELEYEKLPSENQTLYLSYFEREGPYHGYAGFLQNEVENGGIEIIYQTECVGSKEECEELKTESKARMKEQIESIQFTLGSNESE